MEKAEERFTYFLVTTLRMYHQYMSKHLKELGVSLSDYSAIVFLFHEMNNDNERVVTQALIADTVSQDRGLMSRTIRRLKNSGIVSVSNSSKNHSHHSIQLTEKGIEIGKVIHQKTVDWEQYFYSAIDKSDRALFQSTIAHLVNYLAETQPEESV